MTNRFKMIAIAALAASVSGIALSAQAGNQGQGKLQVAGMMGHDSEMGGMGKRHGHKGGRRGAKMFMSQYDLDNDGVVTAVEFDEVTAKRFAEGDADVNGAISLDEFKDGFAERSKTMQVRVFQRLDKDGDGIVSTEEFNRMTDRMFSRMDRDGNGELERKVVGHGGKKHAGTEGQGKGKSRDEAKEGGRKFMHGGHEGKDRYARGGRGGMKGSMMGHMFVMLDTDNDGKVTRAEFEDVRGKLFALADTDNSGGFELTDFSTIWMTLNNGRVVRMFQGLDADGDLAITSEEFAERAGKRLDRMDRNDDGVVSKADFKRMHSNGKKGSPRG
ncbi:EF-hand domain-containing protein [Roseibium algae]|uniref:EF-hand domain-containing protein n=1 Tax=Roseibium algae TaxID=3123038 RepID=A0ABU8TI70_9HYPH